MAHALSNLILDSLPAAEKALLKPHLEPIPLPAGKLLFEAGERPRYVHFLTSGMVSVVTPMADGSAVEVGLVSREGLVEALHLLGDGHITTRAFIQIPGSGFRMSFKVFQEQFFQNHAMRLALRYAQYQSQLLSQIAACNRLHEVEERLARWLLMVADRIGTQELNLTQEFLASMLGSRRATVTIVAGMLQRGGLIQYHRGLVEILDRENLEATACECYAVTKRLLEEIYKAANAPL